MITKKSIFIVILSSFIFSVFISLIFTLFSNQTLNIKDINISNSISDNTDVLLDNLKTINPLLRRDAIINLGKQKETKAIMPLFALLMDTTTTDPDIKAIALSLYQITNGKIISYITELLSITYNKSNSKDSKDIKKLSAEQTINLLYVLLQMNKEQLEKEKYNLDFLDQILKVDNNNLLLVALNCISAFNYDVLYYSVQNLYSKNLFLKIPVIQTLTYLSLNSEKYKAMTMKFILKQIEEEVHPNVQEENYLALYMLTQHLLEVSPATQDLAKKIVGLNSSSFDFSLQQEELLIKSGFQEEQISLIQFFFSDFISIRLKSRLLHILLIKNQFSFLEKKWLYKNIQQRYINTDTESSALELAKTSLFILAKMKPEKEDLRNILTSINDRKLTFTVVSIINAMIEQKYFRDALVDFWSTVKNIIYAEPSLLSWWSYITYQVKGLEELKRILDVNNEKNQMQIFHDLSGCKISVGDRKELVDIYGVKSKLPFFQVVLDEMTHGGNTCYLG